MLNPKPCTLHPHVLEHRTSMGDVVQCRGNPDIQENPSSEPLKEPLKELLKEPRKEPLHENTEGPASLLETLSGPCNVAKSSADLLPW